jgi:hypothetical protein
MQCYNEHRLQTLQHKTHSGIQWVEECSNEQFHNIIYNYLRLASGHPQQRGTQIQLTSFQEIWPYIGDWSLVNLFQTLVYTQELNPSLNLIQNPLSALILIALIIALHWGKKNPNFGPLWESLRCSHLSHQVAPDFSPCQQLDSGLCWARAGISLTSISSVQNGRNIWRIHRKIPFWMVISHQMAAAQTRYWPDCILTSFAQREKTQVPTHALVLPATFRFSLHERILGTDLDSPGFARKHLVFNSPALALRENTWNNCLGSQFYGSLS